VALADYKTHIKNHYESKVAWYLRLRRIIKYTLPAGVTLLYLSIPLAVWSIDWIFLPLGTGTFFFFVCISSSVYTLARAQKTKDILAYDLFRASELFEAYSVESERKTKARFLEKCLEYIRQFCWHLEKTLENANISLSLPNLVQLRSLQENVMNRVYPMVQEGRNTPDDILLSLSKIFFYENEYEKLPDLNSTMEKALQSRPFEEARKSFFARIRQHTVFKCIVCDLAIILLIFGGIYFFKYPIELSDYWTYLGNNAATVVGAITASTLAVMLFFYRGKPR